MSHDALAAQPSSYPTSEERLKQLMDRANDVEVIDGLNMQQYLRAMRSMVSMVDVHINEHRPELAYTLALKFAVLYLEKLPQHREYATLCGKEKEAWNTRCKRAIHTAEILKEELKEKFDLERRLYLENEARKQKEAEEEAETLKKKSESLNQDLAVLPSPPDQLPDGVMDSKTDTGVLTPGTIVQQLPPHVDRSLKPVSKTDASGRIMVRLSMGMAHHFVQLAQSNTLANKETCGNLCGKLIKNTFVISDLVIPKQSGTADTCLTHKEEELFDYVDKNGLIVIGWIHTHPTQTAFLSSVDLHSQLSYQITLPESIAIVCAPKFNEVKVFSLNSYGLSFVRRCNKQGFHPHQTNQPLFEPSQHVINDLSIPYTVVDLRRP
ncbi:unnamed protein product [Calicophoron daubneyi]|uniref:MPN domain-containing protein n=1 Tax=Calicophoron daubneyi TaxID=300641 RepID=A0AAV2T6E5_CALDB